MADTSLLRAFAALLIANSHLEDFYPIRQLAADGLLGDTLFFMLSGYGLVLSESRTRRPFLAWYGRRLGRIYPSVFLVVLAYNLLWMRGWRTWTAADYVWNFARVPSYGFVAQIFLYYAACFPILRYLGPKAPGRLVLAAAPLMLGIPFLDRHDPLVFLFHWVFYFQVMMFGAWLAQDASRLRPGGLPELVGAGVVLAAYILLKWVARGPLAWAYGLQFPLIFPLLYFLFRLARAPGLQRRVAAIRPLAAAVALIGASTLEIYLVHYGVLMSPRIAALAFPANVAVFLLVSLALAQFTARAAGGLRTVGGRVAGGIAALPAWWKPAGLQASPSSPTPSLERLARPSQ